MVLLGALGVFALLLGRSSAISCWRWIYPPTAAGLLAVQFWLTGLYWPLFPVDAVILVCAIVLPLARAPRGTTVGRPVVAASLAGLLLCLASLVFTHLLPRFQLPAPTGPYPVGTRTEHLFDAATGRELVTQFWYPAAPAPDAKRAPYMRLRETRPRFVYFHALPTNSFADAPLAASAQPFPLLLFGHMWGGRRTQDTFLAEDLASHGYVVAATDHPGNADRIELADGEVLRSDRAEALSDPERSGVAKIHALWTAELKLWTADNEFLLNTLAARHPAWLAGRIDLARVGAFGHSFGGAASVALLGLDPRVKSAINLDGWTFDALDHRTTEPVLFLYEAREEGMAGGAPTGSSADDQLERTDRALVDAALAHGNGAKAYVLGTRHADFTDETLFSPVQRLSYTGPIAPARARTITRGLVLGFFNQTLRGQGNVPTYPEVQITPVP